MKILFIGDIFSSMGREAVKKVLPDLKREIGPDLVIANAENLTHGDGFTSKHIEEMRSGGVDFFTTGNHVWGKADGVLKLNDENFPVIRPANFPSEKTPGRGYVVLEVSGLKLLIINLMGRVFMGKHLDCPFRTFDKILEEVPNVDHVFVDFHAEATSEKLAFGYYVDGRASAVVGTHTHVPTCDFQVLAGGTAYITDVGFTGSFDSVIGMKKEVIIEGFLTQLPVRHETEKEGRMVFNSVLIELDEGSKKALNVLHVQKILSP